MRCGIFSGDALATGRPSKLVAQVRASPGMAGADLAGEVTTAQPYMVPADRRAPFSVAALDLGIKANTPRMLAARGDRTHVLPAARPDRRRSRQLGADGVFLSNGPGDPATADAASR